MELKIQSEEFLGDMTSLLRPGDGGDLVGAWDLVRERLVERL